MNHGLISLMTPLLALVLAQPLTARAQHYEFQSVDFPGAANTALYAINDHEQVVGAQKDAAGAHHAIVGTAAGSAPRLALLDPTGPIGGAAQSWAYSISNNGDICGAFVDAAGAYHGYVRWRGGAVEVLDVPDGVDTQAYGINDHGIVIGVNSDSGGQAHAFVWQQGRFSSADLPGALQTVPLSINDDATIVGEYLVSNDTLGYGYLQRRGGGYTLSSAPGAAPQQTYFISINRRGEVLGAYADAAGAQHNFIRRGGRYSPFGLPASFGTGYVSAQTINDGDDVVGYYLDGANVAHGFVAKASKRERDEDAASTP